MSILGLDIGGANLKGAHSGGTARSMPFALWKHPERLTTALAALSAVFPSWDALAITMTGELCDCFATRREGVQAILRSVQRFAGSTPIHVWTREGRFIDPEPAHADPLGVAAVNWLALAHCVAREFIHERVILIDTGSTTTDLVYLDRGTPAPRAFTDVERLRTGELVYTGIRRTPICAVLGMEVAAEFFATMLDAYVFLGHGPENPEDCDTADGRPVTRAGAHARIARLLCADAETFSELEAMKLAQQAVSVQRQAVFRAFERVLAGRHDVDRVIVAGSGELLGRWVAERWGKPVTSLADLWGPALSEAACAYAVARLAREVA